MKLPGQRQVDAAKADGRWNAAYAPIRAATEATIPDDLRAAIDANPRPHKTFQTLGRLNLFALAFRADTSHHPNSSRLGEAPSGATRVPSRGRGARTL